MTISLSFKDLRRRLREKLGAAREKLGAAREKLGKAQEKLRAALIVGIPGLIFLISILIFINVLKEPIILASFILGHIVLVIFLTRFSKNFYNKKIFLTVYRRVLDPITGVLILFIIMFIFFEINLELSAFAVGFVWIFSSALFVSFVPYIWLQSLRKEKPPFQTDWALKTAWIYRLSKNFRLYLLLGFGAWFTSAIWVSFRPLPLFWATYFTLLSYYFIILFIAAVGFFSLSNDDIRKYCRIGLTEIKKWLEFHGKDSYKEENIFMKDYLPIFLTIVDQFNILAKRISLDLPPHVPDSYSYYRALFASAISRDKQRFNAAENGLSQMIDALDIKTIDFFYPFIKGLKQIEGIEEEKLMFRDITEAFELPFGLTRRLKRNYLYIEFGIFVIVIIGLVIELLQSLPI